MPNFSQLQLTVTSLLHHTGSLTSGQGLYSILGDFNSALEVRGTNYLQNVIFTFPSHMYMYMSGIVRCLACGDNWVAVGTNNGTVNTLDLRMGELLHQWKPSDYSIVQVYSTSVIEWSVC